MLHKYPFLIATVAWMGLQFPKATAVGFDENDFIISFATDVSLLVYDEEFNYKGVLGDPAGTVTGLDFDRAGNLVARGGFRTSTGEIAVFDSSGLLANPAAPYVSGTGGVLDLKVAANGNYVVGAQDAGFGDPNGLLEVTPAGDIVRQLGSDDYEGVAALPDGTVWGGGGSGRGFLRVFDFATGVLADEFLEDVGGRPNPDDQLFDNGQQGAHSMFYSAATDTVLIADRQQGVIYERATDRSYVRSFEIEGFSDNGFQLLGVTRGPGGDVYAAYDSLVTRWTPDGIFVETINLGQGADPSWNIVWTGNAEFLLLGDYDASGQVEQGDLDLVLQNWGRDTDAAGVPGGWMNDLPLGLIEQTELDGVLQNWGSANTPDFGRHPVPEPAVLGLLVLLAGQRRLR